MTTGGIPEHPRYESPGASIDELVRAKGVKPISSLEDLACEGLLESDDELDAFLAYTYAARRAELA